VRLSVKHAPVGRWSPHGGMILAARLTYELFAPTTAAACHQMRRHRGLRALPHDRERICQISTVVRRPLSPN
jgi:hypothetical protein